MEIDTYLVRRFLAAQFPQQSSLPLRLVDSVGWDNIIYRLGADQAARLPCRPFGAMHVEQEQRWLPVLASQLPLAVPVLLGLGAPASVIELDDHACPGRCQ